MARAPFVTVTSVVPMVTTEFFKCQNSIAVVACTEFGGDWFLKKVISNHFFMIFKFYKVTSLQWWALMHEHYSDVIWATWSPKQPADRLFVQQFACFWNHCKYIYIYIYIYSVRGTAHLKQHSFWMATFLSGLKIFEIAFQDVTL